MKHLLISALVLLISMELGFAQTTLYSNFRKDSLLFSADTAKKSIIVYKVLNNSISLAPLKVVPVPEQLLPSYFTLFKLAEQLGSGSDTSRINFKEVGKEILPNVHWWFNPLIQKRKLTFVGFYFDREKLSFTSFPGETFDSLLIHNGYFNYGYIFITLLFSAIFFIVLLMFVQGALDFKLTIVASILEALLSTFLGVALSNNFEFSFYSIPIIITETFLLISVMYLFLHFKNIFKI